MPFGKWDSFDACVVDMRGEPNNYDEDTAKKTCGKLQARLEGKELFKIIKSNSGRRVIAQYVSVADMDKDLDILPLPRLKEMLEDLKAKDPRYHNVMWKHGSFQIGHPLWNFKDDGGETHRTEVDEYGLWGITEIRNDGYLMADNVWKKILNGIPMGASIALFPVGQPLQVTKDVIVERGFNPAWEGGRYWDVPLQAAEPWSLTESPANQYVTSAVILAKELCEPCIEARAQWYLRKDVESDYFKAYERATKFFERKKDEEAKKTKVVKVEPIIEKIDVATLLQKHKL